MIEGADFRYKKTLIDYDHFMSTFKKIDNNILNYINAKISYLASLHDFLKKL
jgi:hypothetical protein